MPEVLRIEAVQRSYTARVSDLDKLNYPERLNALNQYSLQRRRERYILITMWKISVGMLPNTLDIYFYHTPRFGLKAKARRLHLRTIRFNFFTSTGPALYNILPKELKVKSNIHTFKKNLDTFLMEFPDKPPCPGYQCANNNSLLSWAACRGYPRSRAPGVYVGEADEPDLAVGPTN